MQKRFMTVIRSALRVGVGCEVATSFPPAAGDHATLLASPSVTVKEFGQITTRQGSWARRDSKDFARQDGWRVKSPSDMRQMFSKLGWQGAKTALASASLTLTTT
jgi:hypothetical protein